MIASILITLALTAASAHAQSVSEDTVETVISAMRVPYSKIYVGARCDQHLVKDVWYLRCHPGGEITGGLWAVVDGPALVPVNGRAMQHAGEMGAILDNDLKAIPVKKWAVAFPGTIPDVASALAAFGK
jgi:hypothetical protein